MHISITGDLGSGKSTVAKEICRILNFKYLSTGLIQRQLALEKGMDTLEFNKFTDQNASIDDYIDQKLKDINEQTDSYVLDSRLGWHFVKKSFKVYIMAVDEVAASRVLIDAKRIGEPQALDIKAKILEQKERRKIENDRFKKSYGVKPSIFKDFDAVIDTSTATIEEVTNLVLSLFDSYCKGENYPKVWLSPLRIFPTDDTNLIESAEAKAVKTSIETNGYDNSFPVSCLLFKKEFYVFDGHKRLSGCIFTKPSFIPVALLAKNEEYITPSLSVEQYLIDSFNMKNVNAWEKAHNFTFFHYPAE